jgi:hypothetical protein
MADKNKSWNFTLGNEDTVPPTGKVVNDGSGAIARLGVNSHWFPEALSDGFYSMALPDALAYAENIFVIHFWEQISGEAIVGQLTASKFADLAYNASVDQATLIVQRAVNTVWTAQPLKPDGIPGAWTLARVNAIIAENEEELYEAIIAQGSIFYEVLRVAHPDKFSQATEESWLTRLNKRPPV